MLKIDSTYEKSLISKMMDMLALSAGVLNSKKPE